MEPYKFVHELDYLVGSLIDPKYMNDLLTCTKKPKWKCAQCGDIWMETIASRKRHLYCPNCQERKTGKRACRLCINSECNKYASFNYPEYRWVAFCRTCAQEFPGMIDIAHKRCEEKGCNKLNPCFNFPDVKPGVRCFTHKLVGMINVAGRRCNHPIGCIKRPNFGWLDDPRATRCSEHREIGMVDIVNKQCDHESGCHIQPSFGWPDDKRALRCFKHKEDDMINVHNKRCAYKGCSEGAYYDIKGSNKRTWCSTHKTDDMIDPYRQMCSYSGCIIGPSFNYEGLKPMFCCDHAYPGMVNVISKRCEINKCLRQATFAFQGESRTRCGEHKLPGMFYKRCAEKDCPYIPVFNMPSQKSGLYCSLHKTLDMVNVVNARCASCTLTAKFNIPGIQPMFCSEHKGRGMISKPTKQCGQCKKLATHGIAAAIHCETHADPEDVNLLERKCKSCDLDFVLNIDDLCDYCDPHQTKKYRKAKEMIVKDFLDAENMKYDTHDRIIERGACGKERPDFLFDCGTHFVIVEVDENQHSHITPECENIRMKNIHQALGLSVVFIRYNPDNYTVGEEKKRTSGKSSRLRLAALRDTILDCQEIVPETSLSAIYLFYDGWDGQGWITDIQY